MVTENATGLAEAQLLEEGVGPREDESPSPAPNLKPKLNPLSVGYLPFHSTSREWGDRGIALFSFNTGLT